MLKMCSVHTYLKASLVQGPGSISNPVASFQSSSNKGMMLPALELSEGAQVRVGIV